MNKCGKLSVVYSSVERDRSVCMNSDCNKLDPT